MSQASLPQPTRRLRRAGMFSALSAPNYRHYWFALVLYTLGSRAEFVTFAWLVWELTHQPLYLGYLGLAQGLPFVFLVPYGGVLADRVHRVRLLVVAQSCTAVSLTIALGLTATGLVRVEHLLVLGVLGSTFRAFDEPSRQALVPQLVGRDQLRNAIALGSIPWQSTRVVGPAVAGVLIGLFGGAAGFALAAVASYGAIGFFSLIRIGPNPAPGKGEGVLQQMVDGLTYIARNPLVASLIGLSCFNSLFGMLYLSLLPIYADQYMRVGSEGYGLMHAATGAGALAGTFTITLLAHRLRRQGWTMLGAAAAFGVVLMLFSQTSNLGSALVLLALSGLSSVFYLTLVHIALQENVPDGLRGRVMSIYSVSWNLIPVAGMVGGALAAAVDARFAVMVGGLMVAGLALVFAAWPSRVRSIQ